MFAYLFHWPPSELDNMDDRDIDFWAPFAQRILDEQKRVARKK